MLTTSQSLESARSGSPRTTNVFLVEPRNADAARVALWVVLALAGGAVLHGLLGGDSPWPAIVAAAFVPMLLLAARAGCSIEVRDDGVVRRGLFHDTFVPWHKVRAVHWRRLGGEEVYRATTRA